MSILGYIISFVLGFGLIFLVGYLKSKAITQTLILSAVFFGGSVTLAAHLKYSISGTIEEREMIASREAAVINKLQLIREAEIVYLEVNGNYTSDWDKLVDFIENGKYPIVQKKERVVTLSYGADSSIITYDTLDIIPAKDRIFKTTHNVNAANDGTFVRFLVSEGGSAEKGAGGYVLNQNGKEVTHKFKNSGTVIKQFEVAPGTPVTKGELLMSLEETKFDLSTDLSRLAYVPGHENVKFDIYADEIERSNLLVDVIEVKNPRPFDPARKEDNESKNRRPLRFGSRTDVTTSGNWE